MYSKQALCPTQLLSLISAFPGYHQCASLSLSHIRCQPILLSGSGSIQADTWTKWRECFLAFVPCRALLFRPYRGDSGFSVLIKSNDSHVVDKRYGNRSLGRLIILSYCANPSFSMTASFVMWLSCHIILCADLFTLSCWIWHDNGSSTSCLYSV